MTELCKYDELRFKTDLQLIQLIQHELDFGICVARQALKSADDLESVNACYRTAKKARAEATRLIVLLGETERDERNGIIARLERLGDLLGPLAAIGSTPTPSEDTIAAVAHALWEVRGCPEGVPEEDWYRAERVLRPPAQSFAACVGCYSGG